ncbi:hypothetical protein [Campylobacter sp. MG1]|uniref:hypothetical protein n=1 Tax=Campylobacter sp. MG1 TaxID=2976332 RepID=UPI00226D01E6|nr:hypothetical protein [Campylobacter sp. MG1]
MKFSKIDFFIYISNVAFYFYCVFIFKYFTIYSPLDIVANSILILACVAYYFYLYLKNELTFNSFFVFTITSFVLVNILLYGSIIL